MPQLRIESQNDKCVTLIDLYAHKKNWYGVVLDKRLQQVEVNI